MNKNSKTRTEKILVAMKVLIWIFFIGNCIKTGALAYSFFISLSINPNAASDLYMGLNLSEVLVRDNGHYSFMVINLIVLSAFRTFLVYLVLKIFLTLNLKKPFSVEMAGLIKRISILAISIGFVNLLVRAYVGWLLGDSPSVGYLAEYLYGSAEFIFFGIIIFIIGQVFQYGLELQAESELTV
ncbi:MAG: DUF2975 domain-containing protein [Algoriphagus sp.]|uniref:DUF2975 domain-containing protein n=1 Tax=Algoriphagus sp. TaxID=1872435 RepID=UPI0026073768|nr:DUF2975 domain-containing protein [Algoriphagus sp.]MDG1279180.1 DUF2975 domain-containing protein [Algoriphagus sp.]